MECITLKLNSYDWILYCTYPSCLFVAFMGGVIGYLIGKYWKKKQRMKKISFNLKYLITKYDWCFYFIPSLIVWKPYSGVYEINVAFLLWEFNIKYQLKRNKK